MTIIRYDITIIKLEKKSVKRIKWNEVSPFTSSKHFTVYLLLKGGILTWTVLAVAVEILVQTLDFRFF